MDKEVTNQTKITIAVVGILTFIGILVETSMNVTFPTLMKTFDQSLSTVQWLTTGYLLMVTLVMGSTSFLLKRFDKRRLFLLGAILSLAGGLLCLVAPNFPFLLCGRLLQASATGISIPLMFSVIFTAVPMKKWGTYTGFAAMLISLAPALGPTYGGIMNHYFSWRAIFSITSLLVIISFALGLVNFKRTQSLQTAKFDLKGFLTLSIFLIFLEFGIQQLSSHLTIALILLFIGFVALLAFIVHEQKEKNVLFNPAIFKQRYLMFRLVNYFMLQMINISLSFVIPIYTENVLFVNSLIAGLVLLPGSLLGSMIAPAAGRWYDRVGAKRPLVYSNWLVILGMLLFTVFISRLSIIMIGLAFVITRLGFNLGFGNTMSDASKAVVPQQKADQNALFSMSQQYAGSIGTAIMSTIISFQEKGAVTNHSGITHGCQLGFAFLLICGLSAQVITLISNKELLSNEINY
ncbi:MFS transporter permease [Oenococcus oeni IOEB_C23]|uniref:MFS transporter n=1 Tax=Oenococcus oeni TaxID=1247 RepID=UPI00051028AD|nr:MFS transporter [Oenococcus oeni]KGH64654.1 MFS transporter permease [Oenococcus oeni IOEB_C23]